MEGEIVVVLGLCRSAADAEEILDRFTSEGFSSDEISVLLRDAPDWKRASGTLGLLAGIGALEIPGTIPLLAAGPIRDEMEASRVGGAAGVGLVGLLPTLGIPHSDAEQAAARIHQGSVLLTVQCRSDTEVARASEILSRAAV